MRKAFTLVELLIVIAILAVLSVVVFVVINPGQRIADAQNATVRNDAQTVQKAFELYAVDNGGAFPDTDAGEDLISDFSSSSLPTSSCTEDIHGSTVTAADLADFITEDNDFIPEYLSEESANLLTDAKIFYYSPAQQIVVCNPLADSTAYNYPELEGLSTILADGDMEAPNTSAWNIGGLGLPVLTKETVNPHSGSRVLRVTATDNGHMQARQSLTNGQTYMVSGYARSDGSNYPRVAGTGSVWTGTTSTSWQFFSETFTANGSWLYLGANSATTGSYVEFDDVVVTEVP